MNIVVLDGYTLNPGDLSWKDLKSLGTLTVYDKTAADSIFERAKEAEIVLTGNHRNSAEAALHRCFGDRLQHG